MQTSQPPAGSQPPPGSIRLGEVLSGRSTNRPQFFGTDDIFINSCCDDYRTCRQGDLYAAIVDADRDGHDYADEAIHQGAGSLLAERLMPLGVPMCVVDDTRDAYGRICHRLAESPCDAMAAFGITGSYGKTTTAMLLTAILEQSGANVGIASSLGYCDGSRVATDVAEPPAIPQFVRWLAAMRDRHCTHAVIEASSQGLANRSYAGAELEGAIFTNVRRAHLDLHGSVINYRKIKQRLLSLLKPHGFVILNADDPASRFMIEHIHHPMLTFGMKSEAELTATAVESCAGEQTFLLHAGSDTMPVRTRIVGRQHIYNCMAAASVGLVLGMDLSEIVRGLESVDCVPGRMERIDCGQSFSAFVDQGCTPDSLAAALQSLQRVTKGQLICVYGARGDGDPVERPLLGRVVEKYADVGILTRNNPGDEDAMQIAHDVLDGYDRPAMAHLLPDRAKAIGWALCQAKEGDTVLISGRGHEPIELVGSRQVDLDDREVVKHFLYELGGEEEAFRRQSA